ncbi:hypothetical protein BKIR_c60_2304 [Candidatus Paraburkholderia kirkii UZHbot1]|uniref:Uncharacterized protein n=1 Tax=Candidatus Paraburkholderia kirkii UZHbot1 TaxID=1055526 RepID=G4MFW4_9BURK|nr:hypothetical protein BKIR_c60_2304 [Candidatus Paraburkholderia kirkii UZHbot1]
MHGGIRAGQHTCGDRGEQQALPAGCGPRGCARRRGGVQRNAKLLPPNDHAVSGRTAITRFWQGAIDSGLKSMKLTSVEVEAHGDTAYEVGKWSIPGEGGKIHEG